jgi:parallel beta-helix repeat protein
MLPRLPKTKGLMIALLIFVLTLTVSADDLSSCGLLDSPNTLYGLTNNINSSGTCITIGANNVTLDCRGYTINYSQSALGYGIEIYSSNYSTIMNCVVEQGSDTNDSLGIYFYDSDYGIVSDNTISTLGASSDGIYLNSSYENDLSGNTIYCSGYSCEGITVYWSFYNDLSYNTVYSSGSYGDGIYLTASTENRIFSNNISTQGNAVYGFYIVGACNDNNISQNTVNTSGGNGIGTYLGYGSGNSFIGNGITTSGGQSKGIWLDGSDSNNLSSNTVSTSGSGSDSLIISASSDNILSSNIVLASGYSAYGLALSESSNNTIANSTFGSGDSYAVDLVNSSDNLLYNNLFNGSDGILSADSDDYSNYWNVSLQSGTRIYSAGSNIGGNYYTNPSGTGFSDNCANLDDDGFCDEAYDVYAGNACSADVDCGYNIDYLPYSDGLTCELGGNYDSCEEVSLREVVDYINAWIRNEATLSGVVRLINAWAGGMGT